MRRSLAVALALVLVVQPLFLDQAIAQPSQPELPDPPEAPEDQGDQPPTRGSDDDPPVEVDPPVDDAPGQPLPADAVIPATFFDEGFQGEQPLAPWAQQHLEGDDHDQSLWQIAPLGREEDPAATLAEWSEAGPVLPADLHQALVSPAVDLTAVPALDPGQAPAGDQAEQASASAAERAKRPLATVATGEVESTPRAPARLVVDHRYSFPDDRVDEDTLAAGFTIEARAPGGQWVALEPLPGHRTASSLRSPPAEEARSEVEDVRFQSPIFGWVRVWDGCVRVTEAFVELPDGRREIPATVVCQPEPTAPDLTPIGGAAGATVPVLADGRVRPLNAQGYTGTSDHDGDGQADVVSHAFDLSPWAGSEVEVRFRAGTSNFDETDAFWAIDRARVEAGSHVANLRLQVAAPSGDHLAPPGEPFPLRVQVQNVGQFPQDGPFDVAVTVTGPDATWSKNVTLGGPLGFLEKAEGEVLFVPTASSGYTVQASIESHHPDADPRDDEGQSRLPVGVDETARLRVIRPDPVIEPGDVVEGTVVVENQGNVPLEGELTVEARPYDATTGGPSGDAIPLLSQPQPVSLPADQRRHPSGAADPVVGVPFEGPVPEGSYLIVARVGDAVGTSPLGVGAPAPPLLVEGFERVGPGETSLDLEAGSGTWQVRAESDLHPGFVYPNPATGETDTADLDPGTAREGSQRGAWVTLAHDGLVLTPTDDKHLARAWTENRVDTSRDQEAYVDAPRGPVSVSVLTREVDLRDVDSAELGFLAALSIPPDELGLTEMRVHVQPKVTENLIFSPILDAYTSILSELLLDPPQRWCAHEDDAVADQAQALPVETCMRLGSGITDPCTLGPWAEVPGADVAGAELGGRAEASACVAAAPRWDALAPLLSGDQVHRELQGHPWEPLSVDLTPYTGSVVDVSFVLISEAGEADAGSSEDRAQASYETTGQLRSTMLLDQIHVMTDEGLRLSPSNLTPAQGPEALPVETLRRDPEEGWRGLGTAYLTQLGPDAHVLHTQAQALHGAGRPTALGADAGNALALGTTDRGDRGVQLFDTDQTDEDPPPHPHAQPAVTVLASPEIDLAGLQRPALSFEQRYQLSVGDRGQPLAEGPDADDVRDALSLPEGVAAACQVQDPTELTLDHLRCFLDRARARHGSFDVPSQVLDTNVSQPPVAAGMFLRVSAQTPDGWTDLVPVAPVDGYRYPAADAGGFQPTLGYEVTWRDETRAYALDTGRNVRSDTQMTPSRFNGTAVWAGDSDTTGDGQPDWVPTNIDLSPWAGQRIQLEFVLVTRSPDLIGVDSVEGLPWAIDDLVVSEAEAPGRVTLHKLSWPNDHLPLLEPGEPLPVRVTATTPTGLDGPVHTTAVLQDATGCVVGTATGQARYRDEAGRQAPMPADQTLDIEMLVPGEDVRGDPPWTLRVAADVGRTPALPTPATVDLVAAGGLTRDPVTGVYDVEEDSALEARVTSPTCDPQPRAWVLAANPHGAQLGEAVELPHRDGDVAFEVTGSGVQVLQAGPRGSPFHNQTLGALPGASVLAVAEASGSQAGVDALVLRSDEDAVGVQVVPEDPRVAPGTPVEVQILPGKALERATLELIPLEGEHRSQSTNLGPLSPLSAERAAVTPDHPGPHLLVVTGQTPEGDVAVGAAALVVVETAPATDPILSQRLASLDLDQGRSTGLQVVSLEADPVTGLSTQERVLKAVVHNPGNVRQEDVVVTFRAGGETLRSESLGTLLPGEHREVAAVYTPLGGTTVVEAEATTEDHTSRATTAVQALPDLGTLRPVADDGSHGWRVDGDRAVFRDGSGSAPRDTVGTLPLEGTPIQGLADFAVALDHDLDMEESFDGGQLIVQGTGDDRPEVGGASQSEMSPFSPVQGQAMTGRLAEQTVLAPDTEQMFQLDRDLSTLEEANATAALDPLWRSITNQSRWDQDVLGTHQVETCTGTTYPGQERPETPDGAFCQWVNPLVPVPQEAFGSDVWFLHMGPYLAPQDNWRVACPEAQDACGQILVEDVTQYLFLEAGSSLVQAAQAEGALSVTFEEARILGGRLASTEATIEVCARFVDYEDRGNVSIGDKQTPLYTEQASQRRCSSLTHDGEPLRQRDWGSSTLRIPNVPQGSFDLVRLEISLRNQGIGGNIPGALQGWFVGPVTAQAGPVSETWSPDASGLSVDPVTGRDDWSEWSREDGDPIGRLGRIVVPQSGLVRVGAEVGGESYDSAPDLGLSSAVPLAACQWPTDDPTACTWYRALEAGPHDRDARVAEMATVPFQLGLSCAVPDVLGSEIDSDENLRCDPGLGMGPQVLSNATDVHPLIDRTRHLDLEATEEDDQPVLTFTPRKGTGYNTDYRLVVPLDLRVAAGRAVAEMDLDVLGATVALAVRPAGTDTWRPVPVCPEDGGRCRAVWPSSMSTARLDLSAFVGQRVEIGARAIHATNDGRVAVRGLTVHGGLLSMVEDDLALRAWTDTSIEGRGWTVDEVRLFGRSFEENVGLMDHDSDLLVQDRLHVHPGIEIDGGLNWTSPLRLKVYNQGPETRDLGLEGTLIKANDRAMLEWAEIECEVTFDPPRLQVPAFGTAWWEGKVSFEDPETCFEELGSGLARHRLLDLRVSLQEPEDGWGAEATTDDNHEVVPLMVDPFFTRRGSIPDLDVFEPHQRGVYTDLNVTPTRASQGEIVTITGTVRAVTEDEAQFRTDLHLRDAGNGTALAGFTQSDASPSISRLQPYEEKRMTWTYPVTHEWVNATLVEATTHATLASGETGTATTHGWLQVPDVDPRTLDALGCRPADLGAQGTLDDATDTWRLACDLGDELDLGAMAPPLVALRATWQMPNPDAEGYTETGWALQVCQGEDERCPHGYTDPDEDRARNWATLRVLEAPPGTLAGLDPDACPIQSGTESWSCEDDAPTTTARETWANVGGGPDVDEPQADVLAGTNPGAAAGRPSLVVFSATECAFDPCPDWTSDNRSDPVNFRAVVFNDGRSQGALNIAQASAAPMAVGLDAPATLGLHAIPEAEPKAVPLGLQPYGAVGTPIDPNVEIGDLWRAWTGGLQEGMVVDAPTEGRVLVESPISPTGTSLGTALGVQVNVPEDPRRSANLVLPIQTQPGLHPNLAVESIRVPSDVTVGDDVTVEAKVRNVGQGTSAEVPILGAARFEDGTVDVLTPATDFETIPPLPPGGETLAVLKWTPSSHGDALVRVAADLDEVGPIAGPLVVPWGDGALREMRECGQSVCPNVAERDVVVAPPPVADLSASLSVDGQEPLLVGEPVTLEMTVHNAGPAVAPAFKARLLAGVVNLLEEDPLVVEEPLAPGETWTTNVTLIPPRAGDLRITASAFSDERLVEEARGLRPDGSMAAEDNVVSRVLPVIARGLELQLPLVAQTGDRVDEGRTMVPLTVVNRGSQHTSVSVAALGAGIGGTLVDANGTLAPVIDLAPGQGLETRLRLTFDEAPTAGRHEVRVEAASAGAGTVETFELEVPRADAWGVSPATVEVQAPNVTVPVPVTNTGNAPVTVRAGLDAPGLEASPVEAVLEPGQSRTIELETRVVDVPADGSVWVRADSREVRAPLLVEASQGSLPVIVDAQPVAGSPPVLEVQVANAGSATSVPTLSTVRDNQTVGEERVALEPGEHRIVEVPLDGQPGNATIELTDGATTSRRSVDIPDLRPSVRVEGLRLSPPAPSDGDRVEVRATLTNTGPVPAEVRPALFVDGEMRLIVDKPVSVEPEAFESVRFTWEADQGERTIAVAADPLQPSVVHPTAGTVGTSVNVTGGDRLWGISRTSNAATRPVPSAGPWMVVLVGLAAAGLTASRRRQDR